MLADEEGYMRVIKLKNIEEKEWVKLLYVFIIFLGEINFVFDDFVDCSPLSCVFLEK